MSITNIVTKQTTLLIATAVFCIFSYVSAVIGMLDKKGMKWSSILFVFEIFFLFTYFIICGGTEGFSTIWLLLLPACGLFAFGKKSGTAMSAVLFVELIFFFYTPIGRGFLLCTEYTRAFMTRFPMVYLAFWGTGYFLETVREETYRQLMESRQKYEYLSNHDELTGLYNRVGFNRRMDLAVDECRRGGCFSLLIMDIDFFKNINDTYGHNVGDLVLKRIGSTIVEALRDEKSVTCRWGGEEFAILLFHDSAKAYCHIAEKLRTTIADTILEEENNIKNTVSIGGVCSDIFDTVGASEIVIAADNMLYQAKENGRNQVQCYEGKPLSGSIKNRQL